MRLFRRHLPGPDPDPSAKRTGPAGPDTHPLGAYIAGLRRPENAPRQGTAVIRLLMTLVLLLLSLCLVLGAVLLYRAPLYTVEPFLVVSHPYTHQLVTVEPLTQSTDVVELMIEYELAHYVRQRHEVIGPGFMRWRWRRHNNFIQTRSSQRVWDQFVSESEHDLDQAREGHLLREVSIDQVVRVDRWLWQVHFTTVTTARYQSEPATELWTAHIQNAPLRFSADPTRAELRLNPLRYVLTSYTLTKRTRKEAPP